MVAIEPVLRINMSGTGATPALEAERYSMAIELASLADSGGFAVVNVEEHHDSEIGWLSSPLTMAAAIAARTEKITIRGSAVLATLYDPIRLAEDVAVIDLLSKGRFFFVLGQGYRESEYHVMDRNWKERGKSADFLIDTLLKAWSGQAFEYRGRMVHVSPRPYSQPHPLFYYGGMSKAAAMRAARWGLPFMPGQPMPEIEQIYRDEARRLGHEPVVKNFDDLSLLFIDPDPDKAWEEIGPHFVHEAAQYAAWAKTGVERHYDAGSNSVEELRKSKVYEIITPEECIERARNKVGVYQPIIHPLAGNIPPERARQSVQLFIDEVLAKL